MNAGHDANLATVTLTGNLNVIAGNDVTVTGTLTAVDGFIDAETDVSLGVVNTTNLEVHAGSDINLTDTVDVTGLLDLDFSEVIGGGSLTAANTINAGTLQVTGVQENDTATFDGAVTTTAGMSINDVSTVDFNSTVDVQTTLLVDNATDVSFDGAVNATAVGTTSVTVQNVSNDLSFGDSVTSGLIQINNIGNDVSFTGVVTADASTVTIQEIGNDVSFASDVTATTDILIEDVLNNVSVAGTTSAVNAEISAGNDIDLATVTLTGNLIANAVNDATVTGTLTAVDATVNAGHDANLATVTLTGNLIANAVNDATVTGTLGAVNAEIHANNNITVDDAVTVTDLLHLDITEQDGVGGVITANSTLTAGTVVINGTNDDDAVVLNGNVLATAVADDPATDGVIEGSITIDDIHQVKISNDVSITTTAGSIWIYDNVDEIVLNGGVAGTNSIVANGGSVNLAAVNDGNTTAQNLTVDVDENVTLVTVDIEGDLDIDFGSTDATANTLEAWALSANSIDVIGDDDTGSNDDNDTATFNSTVTATGAQITIDGVTQVNFKDDVTAQTDLTITNTTDKVDLAKDVDLATIDGSISINNNVNRIYLSGDGGDNSIRGGDTSGNLINVDLTDIVDSTSPDSLTIESEGNISLDTINISGDLVVNGDTGDDQVATIAADEDISAGSVTITGNGSNDTLNLAADVDIAANSGSVSIDIGGIEGAGNSVISAWHNITLTTDNGMNFVGDLTIDLNDDDTISILTANTTITANSVTVTGTNASDSANFNGDVAATAGSIVMTDVTTVNLNTGVDLSATGGNVEIIDGVNTIDLVGNGGDNAITAGTGSVSLAAVTDKTNDVDTTAPNSLTVTADANVTLTSIDIANDLVILAGQAVADSTLAALGNIEAGNINLDGDGATTDATFNGTITSTLSNSGNGDVDIDNMDVVNLNDHLTANNNVTIGATLVNTLNLAENVNITAQDGDVDVTPTRIVLNGTNTGSNTITATSGSVDLTDVTDTNAQSLTVVADENISVDSINITNALGIQVGQNGDSALTADGSLTAGNIVVIGAGNDDDFTFNSTVEANNASGAGVDMSVADNITFIDTLTSATAIRIYDVNTDVNFNSTVSAGNEITIHTIGNDVNIGNGDATDDMTAGTSIDINNVTGNVNLNQGVDLLAQNGNIWVYDNIGGDVQLVGAADDTNTVTAVNGSVNLADVVDAPANQNLTVTADLDVTLASVSIGGDLIVSFGNGTEGVLNAGALTANTITIDGDDDTNNVDDNDTATFEGNVTATGTGDIDISDINEVILVPSITFSTANGDILINENIGSIAIIGDTSGTITMNSVGGSVNLGAVNDGDAISQSLTVNADENVTLTSIDIGNDLVITFGNGVGGVLTAGNLSANSIDVDGTDVDDDTANFNGTVTSTGGDIDVNLVNQITFNQAVDAGANVNIDNAGNVSTLTFVSTVNAGTNLDINNVNQVNFQGNAVAGNDIEITDVATEVDLATNVSLTATAGNISIDVAGNIDLSGTGGTNWIKATAGNVTLTNIIDNGAPEELVIYAGQNITLDTATLDSDTGGGVSPILTIKVGQQDVGTLTTNDIEAGEVNITGLDDNPLLGEEDIVNLNGNVNSDSSVTITDALTVNLASDVDITADDGSIWIFDNIGGIVLDGATSNMTATNGSINLAGVTDNTASNLVIDVDKNVTLATVDIEGDLDIDFGSTDATANTLEAWALSANSIDVIGDDDTGSNDDNDTATFNSTVTATGAQITIDGVTQVNFKDDVTAQTDLTITNTTDKVDLAKNVDLATVTGSIDIENNVNQIFLSGDGGDNTILGGTEAGSFANVNLTDIIDDSSPDSLTIGSSGDMQLDIINISGRLVVNLDTGNDNIGAVLDADGDIDASDVSITGNNANDIVNLAENIDIMAGNGGVNILDLATVNLTGTTATSPETDTNIITAINGSVVIDPNIVDTGSNNLEINSDQDITLNGSVNITGVLDIDLEVEDAIGNTFTANDSLTAGTVVISGTGGKDVLVFNGDVTANAVADDVLTADIEEGSISIDTIDQVKLDDGVNMTTVAGNIWVFDGVNSFVLNGDVEGTNTITSNGGSVNLTDVNDDGDDASINQSLTIDADQNVTLATVDLGSTLTISFGDDANVGALTEGILEAGNLTVGTLDVDGNEANTGADTANFNGTVTTTVADININQVSQVNFNEDVTASTDVTISNVGTEVNIAAEVDITAQNGNVNIKDSVVDGTDDVAQINLSGVGGINIIQASGSVDLAAVIDNATDVDDHGDPAELQIAAGTDVELTSVSISNILNIDVSTNDASADTLTSGRLLAGTMTVDGSSMDDTFIFNDTVTTRNDDNDVGVVQDNSIIINQANLVDLNGDVRAETDLTFTNISEIDIAENVDLRTASGSITASTEGNVSVIDFSGDSGTNMIISGDNIDLTDLVDSGTPTEIEISAYNNINITSVDLENRITVNVDILRNDMNLARSSSKFTVGQVDAGDVGFFGTDNNDDMTVTGTLTATNNISIAQADQVYLLDQVDAGLSFLTDEINELHLANVDSGLSQDVTADTIYFNGNLYRNKGAGDSAYKGNITLTFDGQTTVSNHSGDITITGTIDGDTYLAIWADNGDDDQTISVEGNVGAKTPLERIRVTADNIWLHDVQTVGSQKYIGDVFFNSAYVTENSVFFIDGDLVLGSDSSIDTGSGDGTILITGNINGSTAGEEILVMRAGKGRVQVDGDIGNTVRLETLDIEAARIDLNQDVTTQKFIILNSTDGNTVVDGVITTETLIVDGSNDFNTESNPADLNAINFACDVDGVCYTTGVIPNILSGLGRAFFDGTLIDAFFRETKDKRLVDVDPAIYQDIELFGIIGDGVLLPSDQRTDDDELEYIPDSEANLDIQDEFGQPVNVVHPSDYQYNETLELDASAETVNTASDDSEEQSWLAQWTGIKLTKLW